MDGCETFIIPPEVGASSVEQGLRACLFVGAWAVPWSGWFGGRGGATLAGRRVAAGAALLATILGAACAAGTPQVGSTHPGPALVLGDSILVGARDLGELDARLRARGWVPEIIAEEGRSVSWATEVVEARDRVPLVVVVALGSNPGPGAEGFAREIDALVNALTMRGADRIVWIPPVHADPERYAARHRILADAGAPVEVASWPERLGRNPWWLSGDGLHLTGQGYAELAAFVVERLSTASAINAE